MRSGSPPAHIIDRSSILLDIDFCKIIVSKETTENKCLRYNYWLSPIFTLIPAICYGQYFNCKHLAADWWSLGCLCGLSVGVAGTLSNCWYNCGWSLVPGELSWPSLLCVAAAGRACQGTTSGYAKSQIFLSLLVKKGCNFSHGIDYQ